MSKFLGLLLSGAVILHLWMVTVDAKILPQYEATYSNCIREVYRKHFCGTSVSAVLPKFNAKISDTYVRSLHDLYAVTIVDRNKKTITSQSPFYKPENYIFLTTSRLDLINSIQYLKLAKLWNPVARVLVILSNEMVNAKRTSLLNMSEMKKIFGLFMKERSIQVKLIVFDEHQIPKIFAWFPFDVESNCSHRVQVLHPVGECLSDGNAKNEIFMIRTNRTNTPIIPRTFGNCPLTITALNMEPYIICDQQSTCDKGIEIRLFETVAQSLDLNLKLNVEDKLDETVYRRLLTRESDLVIGGLNPLIKIRNKALTQTVPYYQDELTWCVSEASTISLWWSIFLIFDGETWGYFMLTFMLSGTALYYFYKFYHHQENWCYCSAAGLFLTISVPIPFNPTHPLLRIYCIIFCMYGILATTTFNSFLMSTITKPAKYQQISTKAELIVHSIQLYAENETVASYRNGENEFSEYVMQHSRSCADINSCLQSFLSTSSHDIAVATSREHAMNYPAINESQIYCFHKPDNIYTYPVAALAHEHFHLLEVMNHQIQQAIEAGLITKWETDSKLMKKPKHVNNGVVPFSVQNISGGIVALMIGFTLASIGFASEIYFAAKKRAHRNAENSQPVLWRMCEKIWVTKERDAWPEIVRYFRWKTRKNN